MPVPADPRRRRKPSVRREPVLVASLVPIVALLVARFGLDLDPELVAGIVAPLILAAAAWARSKVTPVADPVLDDRGESALYVAALVLAVLLVVVVLARLI